MRAPHGKAQSLREGLSAQLRRVWSADSLQQTALWAASAAQSLLPEVTHFPGWPAFSD